ncbi:Prenyltransferase and squalene oxidase repeat protein [Pseudobythopirellula maris]|uniref:Prenyltransferase and squalene oxidase repeat protein n=1 Tax=Pseudobythopirellula maris TaxID=2527991 RepID=A0A5C5ZTS3_9BACT|nr:DUF4159 domain-containing protein [Pseudobythopirellula maris]TWT90964.1 Prenyltransferase and squalene oxidase repeat protein [Pseudobythopirellula maris]
MRKSQRTTFVTVLLIAATLWAPPARAQRMGRLDEEPLDAARVLLAIDRGVEYIRREQTPRGSWPELTGYPGGVTSLCTLALLSAGVEPTDPSIRRALDYLRSIETSKTYTVAMQTMALAAAEPKRDLVTIQRNVRWLEVAQVKDDAERAGSWTYDQSKIGPDNSNTQFAMLALYEAQRAGARVQPETWRRSLAYWRRTQKPNGSWGYKPGEKSTGSMTCAGIGAVTIAMLAVEDLDARVRGGRVECCLPHDDDATIDRAANWLSRNFSVRRNPGETVGEMWQFYYLYGLERAGRLTNQRFFGEHDWYREGTAYLVNAQDSLAHSWTGSLIEANSVVASSFALLFLSKGRRPILLGKLKHGADAGGESAWNSHRLDAEHLTERAAKAWRLPMTWQVIDAQEAEVDDLLQAPVLYVSGSQAADLLPHAPKLRAYLDRGGFVFAEASCGDPSGFLRDFERLIAAVFPEPEHRLGAVGPGHPLWRMERVVRPDSPYAGRLRSVEYGCRTCVVLCEEDLSCYWELDRPQGLASYPPAVQRRVEDAVDVGLNVLAYATNREPKGKEQLLIAPAANFALEREGERFLLEVAKIQHAGGCNDAPGALANLLRAASQGDARLAISPEPTPLGPGDPELKKHVLSFMHGRRDFRFSENERLELREYLQNGGTLLVDSICASEEFSRALRAEMRAIFPDRSLRQLPADDPVFTTAFGGYDVRRVELRDPQPGRADEPLAARTRRVAPRFEGIEIDGRWAVLFSPYDLSCALESHEAIECRGYRKQDAARLGVNVLLYVVNQ